MKTLDYESLRRLVFGAGLGLATFFMSGTALLSFAKLINLDFRFSWWLLLPVALLAGLVAGATSRQWGFAVGAVAASWWLITLVVTGLAVGIAGGSPPRLDLGLASLLLHPILGGVGGGIGARALPPITLPPMPQSRARTNAILFVLTFASVIAVLYTKAIPPLLFAALLIALGWGYGAYIWLKAKNASERWRAVFFIGMGALLALSTWQTPEPPPLNPAAALGLLIGGALGALLMWRLYARGGAT
ncbi:MAG: hypothetical protein M1570_07625 [Chloroflexi bacterium]|nr:hypothetical protein [Chloroflexota bacterium]